MSPNFLYQNYSPWELSDAVIGANCNQVRVFEKQGLMYLMSLSFWRLHFSQIKPCKCSHQGGCEVISSLTCPSLHTHTHTHTHPCSSAPELRKEIKLILNRMLTLKKLFLFIGGKT